MNAYKIYRMKFDDAEFIKNLHRKVLLEIIFLIILAIFFWSSWSKDINYWLKFFIFIISLCLIVLEIFLSPKTKNIAKTFYIQLLENELEFPYNGKMELIPYSDIKISKVERNNGEIVAICLLDPFNQTIKLQGLENMKELYDEIKMRVVELEQ